MAEPQKPKAKGKSKAGRPAVSDPKRPFASLRGKADFERWFHGLRKHTRLNSSMLIEFALIEYAERHGYDKPAPER